MKQEVRTYIREVLYKKKKKKKMEKSGIFTKC